MYKIFVVGALLISAVALFFSVKVSLDQKKVAYANTTAVLAEYKGTKESQQIYQRKVEVWQGNLDTLVSSYRGEVKKYQSDEKGMSDKEKDLQIQLLERQEKDLLTYKQSIETKIKEEESLMTSSVIKQVNAYIKEYGKEEGYAMILGVTDDGSVLYGEEQDNMTEELITYINAKYAGE